MTKKGIKRLGKIKTEPGTKMFNHLEIGDTANGPLRVPLMLINGLKDGPVICLTAGHHGMEYSGIEAVIRIYGKINPMELNGTVLAVPVVNIVGFQMKTMYTCPIDGVNIASVYPGKEDGSISHIIAHEIFHETVLKADFAIDLHGGDLFESLIPYTFFCTSGNDAVNEASKDMARAYGTKYIFAADDSHMKLMCEAPKEGVPTILAEAGGEGKMDEETVRMHTRGVENVMRHLGMIDGHPRISIQQEKTLLRRPFDVVAKSGGIVYSNTKPGDIVGEGDIVAEIKDLKGDIKEEIRAPIHGLVQLVFVSKVVNSGDRLMRINPFIYA
jgi:hypothetical protein